MKILTTSTIPNLPYEQVGYFFPADEHGLKIRNEITDRTRGWLNQTMLEKIANSSVTIAGAGGMGGHIDDSLLRAAVKHITLADSGIFDYSNIHRQYGANLASVGESKTFATIDMLRKTSTATTLTGFWQGVTEDTVEPILKDQNLAIDSIEYHALGARCLFHETAKRLGVPIMNGNSVGFSTNIFLFEPGGLGLMDVLPFNVEYAYKLEKAFVEGTISDEAYLFLCQVVNAIFLPIIPNYGDTQYDTARVFTDRLLNERTASIVTTNPKMAAGVLADNILLYLTKDTEVYKAPPSFPVFPAYYHYDAALRISETRILDIEKIKAELTAHMPSVI